MAVFTFNTRLGLLSIEVFLGDVTVSTAVDCLFVSCLSVVLLSAHSAESVSTSAELFKSADVCSLVESADCSVTE